MTTTPRKVCLVEYPASQSYTVQSIRAAFSAQLANWKVITSRAELGPGEEVDCEWSDYDEIDWDAAASGKTLVNSYAIRKALIRKNHLSHTLALYLSKNPTSPLRQSSPATFYFNLSFADELDELLQDELYDVALSFDDNQGKAPGEEKWWILKAALADKGNGIRLFSTREQLEGIFDEFEESSDEEEEEEEDDEEKEETNGRSLGYGEGTRVNASQLREWVIQEYISSPLLLDPQPSNTTGTKFHLRVYVLAVGALAVYVHHPFLALFAPTPYQYPSVDPDADTIQVDLTSHLTNTCLQTGDGQEVNEIAVRLLQGLADREIMAGPHKGEVLGEERVRGIEGKVGVAVGETFKAAVGAGSGFQTLPNAFEIFGVDFLVDDQFGVHLLEINACPDFTQTGPELQSVIDQLFKSTIQAAVVPFFAARDDATPGDALSGALAGLEVDGRGLRKVLDMRVRGGF